MVVFRGEGVDGGDTVLSIVAEISVRDDADESARVVAKANFGLPYQDLEQKWLTINSQMRQLVSSLCASLRNTGLDSGGLCRSGVTLA